MVVALQQDCFRFKSQLCDCVGFLLVLPQFKDMQIVS